MADFRASKLIGSTAALNSAFTFPLYLCPHLGNFTFPRFSSYRLRRGCRHSQSHQFLAHLASPSSSVAPRIDIVSTIEQSDGSLLFKFGDPSEIVDRKENSDVELNINQEGELESEEAASSRKIVVEEETSGSGETKQVQTVEVAFSPTEDANNKKTVAVVIEEAISVGKVSEVSGEPNCTNLSSDGDSTVRVKDDGGKKETVTSVIDDRNIEEEDQTTLPGAIVAESHATLTSILAEENKESVTTSAELELNKRTSYSIDEKSNKIRTSIVDEENKKNLISSAEEVHQKSPQVGIVNERSKNKVTGFIDEANKQTVTPFDEDQHKKSPSTRVADEESKMIPQSLDDVESQATQTTSDEEEPEKPPMDVVGKKNKENLTSIIPGDNEETWTSPAREEQKKSSKSLVEEEGNKSQTSIVDEEKMETLTSTFVEANNESITSVVEKTDDLPVDDYNGETEALTMTLGTDNIVDTNERKSHVQDMEEMKNTETALSLLSDEHELHVEGCDRDGRSEIQEMVVNTIDAVSLDASAPTNTSEVDDSEKETKSNLAQMEIEPILDADQWDQMSDDLASMEEAKRSIMVEDNASDKSSHNDRINADLAISCVTQEEDQQLLDTGLVGAVERVEENDKPCPTLVLASGVASLPLPSKALTGEVDAYFIAGKNWFGVANGVGQWSLEGTKDGFYAHEVLQNCKTLVCNKNSIDEVSEVGDAFRQSVASAESPGLASILIAYFDNKVLHVANVGDTGFMVIRNGSVLQRSSPMVHEFSIPVLIGTFDDPMDIIEEYQVEIEDGDVIITATDGLFDNLYEQDIVSIISKSLGANLTNKEVAEVLAEKAQQVGMATTARSPFVDAAQAAGYTGYVGGKPDHVTVIVSLVKKSEKIHVQDKEAMKIIETTSSSVSHGDELHNEGCDGRSEIQEMVMNTMNVVSLDASSAPIDTSDVDDLKNEMESSHAQMDIEPILDEEQWDKMSDDLASVEEAQSSIMVEDNASDKSSHIHDRIKGDSAISCIAQEEDRQSVDAVARVQKDEKPCLTMVLASGVASLPAPSKALTGEVDAYFIAGENWFGVANGVGQWSFQGTKDGSFVHEVLQICETLVCNNSNIDEVSEVWDAFRRSAAFAEFPGLASVLIAYFDNKVLHVANVGDTGYMVIRNGSVLQRSSPMVHEFNLPVLIGTSDDPMDIIKEYKVEVEDGDVVIAATDGLFDNLYEQDLVSLVSKSLGANMTNKEVAEMLAKKAQQVGMSTSARSPFADAAQAAGYAGYVGGKPDHVTVIVSVIKKR